jgi:threonyl-tRNA synthetase
MEDIKIEVLNLNEENNTEHIILNEEQLSQSHDNEEEEIYSNNQLNETYREKISSYEQQLIEAKQREKLFLQQEEKNKILISRLQKEAERRDHRKLGKDLEIFSFDEEVGPGLPLWLPNGAILVEEIEKLAKESEQDRNKFDCN